MIVEGEKTHQNHCHCFHFDFSLSHFFVEAPFLVPSCADRTGRCHLDRGVWYHSGSVCPEPLRADPHLLCWPFHGAEDKSGCANTGGCFFFRLHSGLPGHQGSQAHSSSRLIIFKPIVSPDVSVTLLEAGTQREMILKKWAGSAHQGPCFLCKLTWLLSQRELLKALYLNSGWIQILKVLAQRGQRDRTVSG